MRKLKEKVQCTLCNYSAMPGYRMKRHMRVHTGEKPFVCGMCDQSFTQKSSLKEHLWKHSALRSSHKCSHCDAMFNQQADVSAHMSHMHTACAIQMPCTICLEVFANRYNLLEHQKMHDNIFRYQCLECAFSSRNKKHLIIHMSVHGKRKPLRCSACKAIFKHKHNLLSHLFQKHGISMFGDDFSAAPLKTKPEASPAEVSQKKLTNQQELEQLYEIMDEHGNTLQLSEADAEAIHNAMQQSSGDGTLEIIQNAEGTMTVTVLTVAHNLDGSVQHIEQSVEMISDRDAEEQQILGGEEGLREGGVLDEVVMEEATAHEPADSTEQVGGTSEDIPSTSTE